MADFVCKENHTKTPGVPCLSPQMKKDIRKEAEASTLAALALGKKFDEIRNQFEGARDWVAAAADESGMSCSQVHAYRRLYLTFGKNVDLWIRAGASLPFLLELLRAPHAALPGILERLQSEKAISLKGLIADISAERRLNDTRAVSGGPSIRSAANSISKVRQAHLLFNLTKLAVEISAMRANSGDANAAIADLAAKALIHCRALFGSLAFLETVDKTMSDVASLRFNLPDEVTSRICGLQRALNAVAKDPQSARKESQNDILHWIEWFVGPNSRMTRAAVALACQWLGGVVLATGRKTGARRATMAPKCAVTNTARSSEACR